MQNLKWQILLSYFRRGDTIEHTILIKGGRMKTHFTQAYKVTALTAVSFGAAALLPGVASATSHSYDEDDHKTSYSQHNTDDYSSSGDHGYKDDYEYGYQKYNDEKDYKADHAKYMEYKYMDDSEHMYKSSDSHHKSSDNKYKTNYSYKTSDDSKHHEYKGSESGGYMNDYDDKDHENGSKFSDEHRVELRSHMQEHVAVVGPALKAELTQAPDREAAMDAVDRNTEAIAQKVEEAYSGSKAEFTELWGSHIGYYVDYTQAARDGDEERKGASRQDLQEFADEASAWFAEQNDAYDQNHLRDMMAKHGDHTLAMVDASVQGDYDTAYAKAHEAYMHMGELADYMSGHHTEM